MPFREELWNSELFATVGELAGAWQGRGRRSDRVLIAASSVAQRQSQGTRRQMRAYFSARMGKIDACVVLDE